MVLALGELTCDALKEVGQASRKECWVRLQTRTREVYFKPLTAAFSGFQVSSSRGAGSADVW